MKLYKANDSPPSVSVMMALKALNIKCELVEFDFLGGELKSEKFAKINPQKQIPVLDDDGFYLSESNAIMQYLCDKYSPDSSLYPKDPKQRALVNHRLCFNMSFYYSAMYDVFFDFQRTPKLLKKFEGAMKAFEAYLNQIGTKYVTGKYLTIADLQLVSSTFCVEAAKLGLDEYPLIKKWYNNFKSENPELWKIVEHALRLNAELYNNPPDIYKEELM